MPLDIPSVYVCRNEYTCKVLKHVGRFYIVSTPTDYEPARYLADNKRVFIYTNLDDAIAALLYTLLKKYKFDIRELTSNLLSGREGYKSDLTEFTNKLLLEYRGYKIITVTPSEYSTYYLDESPNGEAIKLHYIDNTDYKNPPTNNPNIISPVWDAKYIQSCYTEYITDKLYLSSVIGTTKFDLTYSDFLDKIRPIFDNTCNFCCDLRSRIALHREFLIDQPKICVFKGDQPIAITTRPLEPKNSYNKYLIIPPNHIFPTMTMYNMNGTYSGASQYYGLYQVDPQKAAELYEFLVASVFAAVKLAYQQTNEYHTLYHSDIPNKEHLVFLWLHATSNTVPHMHIHMTYAKSIEDFQSNTRLYPDYINENHVDIRMFCLNACGRPLVERYTDLHALNVVVYDQVKRDAKYIKTNIMRCINKYQEEQNKNLIKVVSTIPRPSDIVTVKVGDRLGMNKFHLSASKHLKLLTNFNYWTLTEQTEYQDTLLRVLSELGNPNPNYIAGSSSDDRISNILQTLKVLQDSEVFA